MQAIGQPISNAAGANGHIRNFQLIVGGINLSLLPIAWFVLKKYPVPEFIFMLHILVNIIAQIARLLIVKPMISLSLREYVRKVVLPGGLVTILSIPIPLVMKLLLPINFMSFIAILSTSLLCTIVSVYLVGMSSNERTMVTQKIRNIINSKQKKD